MLARLEGRTLAPWATSVYSGRRAPRLLVLVALLRLALTTSTLDLPASTRRTATIAGVVSPSAA